MRINYPQKTLTVDFVQRPGLASSEAGFTLIEAIIAIVLMNIVALGVAGGFVQALRLNSGNSDRAQALTIAQLRLEQARTARFTPTLMDSELAGGTRAAEFVTGQDGRPYQIDVTVDDDPFTLGVQPANSSATLKEITIVVTPLGSNTTWVKGFPVRLLTRRSRTTQ